MSQRDIQVNIQLRLPRWSARRWLGIALVATAIGGAAAIANVMWTPFNGGDKLTAAKLNANFQSMADAINTLQNAPPPSAPQPHLILDNGNVDLGVWLGFLPTPQPSKALLVVYPPVKTAMNLDPVYLQGQTLYFDGPNCTGNAVTGAVPVPFTTVAFNSGTGTIFQYTGVTKMGEIFQSFRAYQNGQFPCVNGPQAINGTFYLLQDTKVANMEVRADPAVVHIEMK